ncbi:hypothetical protein DSI38_09625, partial [Mycobacterium tuberculosis]
IAIGWAPMLLLIAVWLYLVRRTGGMKQSQYFDEMRNYMTAHIAETKRLNANLERIASVLEATAAKPGSNNG